MDRREIIQSGGAAIAAIGLGQPLRAATGAGDPAALPDMAVLRRSLALHPGVHRYLSPREAERELALLEQSWDKRPALSDRYLALSRFLASIRCGHSYGNFFNQTKPVAAELFDRPTRLPLHFVWVGDTMVVTEGFASGLPRGSVITGFNGEAPATLRARLLPYVRTDGHNHIKRVSLLEVRGDDRIETFDVFQGLLAAPPDGIHRLAVRLPDGSDRALAVPAIGLAARRAQMPAVPAADDAPSWHWRMTSDGVAVLTMPGWALWNSKWDWKGWLGDRLDSLDGARGLIVDIRDNEGGEDCGDMIIARLIDRDFVAPRVEQRIRFRRTPTDLDRYLDTWDDSFRTLGEKAAELPGGFYLRPGGDEAMRVPASDKRIRCPVRVLTSPVNSSATFQFAGNLRLIGAGKLVGRATGGNRRGINGGCFFFVRLPQSGIEFDLPLVGYFPVDPQPDAGLEPDIAVAPSIDSITAGRDPELEAAIRSIT